MTDARLGGLGREALVAEAGNVRLAGLAREVLVSGATSALLGGLAREVLLYSTALTPTQQQYAVTIIS